MRGDNYCGVRAALYQILSQGLPVPSGHATHTRLAAELNQGSTWLRDWSFGHRLSFSKEQVLNGFWECLDALDSMVRMAGRGRRGWKGLSSNALELHRLMIRSALIAGFVL